MSYQKRSAVVTGICGMDGSHLADFLLEKDYTIYGLKRRTASNSLDCAAHLENEIEVVEGDLTDLSSLIHLTKLAKADEFYNLGAMSHVGTSFTQPVYTAECTGIGVLNCLEAIRASGYHTRFLQASTSELFGGQNGTTFCNEETSFYPRSPYGVAKLYGYWITVNYREAYKLFACNSICFNHEGKRRGPNFVTRKITQAVAKIKLEQQDKLYLGNLQAKRDWGHAEDFVRGMYLMIHHHEPDDYVLATGETHSVAEFCEAAFNHVGLDYKDYVEIDPQFYRPTEVDVLLGDYSKAKRILGWTPQKTFQQLVQEMVDSDLALFS